MNEDEVDYEMAMAVSEDMIDGHFTHESENYDPIVAIYSTFLHCIHILTQCGWRTEELIQDVMDHTEEVPNGTIQ